VEVGPVQVREAGREAARVPLRLLLVLAPLSAFGPLSMDLYLPALPELARDLHAADAYAQLTMSACMVGLAVGQVVAGALSDRYGRRLPVLVGVALFAALSLGCALAPSMGVLVGLRFLQGLAGAAGIVVARAVVRDLYRETAAARAFSLLMLVVGVAPVLAPVAGGQLVRIAPWRGLFVVLGLIGVVILVASWFGLPETLPPADRHSGGPGETARAFAVVLRDRRFGGYVVVQALSYAALFTYIGSSAFVLQNGFGISPQQFSLVFALNGTGILLAGRLNATLVQRARPGRLLGAGVALPAAVSVLGLIGVLARWGLAPLLVVLFVVVGSVGMIGPNATALAMSRHGGRAGTASAVLGLIQFLAGAAIVPLASLRGATATSMVAAMAGCLVLAGTVLAVGWFAGRSGASGDTLT
jgi:DHA1 family bicyclomycin/chloramphenicol resistance-like MFS transporter